MPISDFFYDPLADVSGDRFLSLKNIFAITINAVFYLLYSFLLIILIFNLVKALKKLTDADRSEAHVEFRNGITNAVLAAIGLLVLSSALFIPKTVLGFFGIDVNLFSLIN